MTNRYAFFWLFISAGLFPVIGSAQEFGLKVNLFRNDAGASPIRTVAIGYDPTAADSLEDNVSGTQTRHWYPELNGEQFLPPLFGDFDFRLTGNYIGRFKDMEDGSSVDVRRKPIDSNFVLKYEMDLLEQKYSKARLEWVTSSIPVNVRHLYLYSFQDTITPALDMKVTSSLTLTNSSEMQRFSSMIIKLVYSTSDASVRDRSESLANISLYPNPASSDVSLSYSSNTEGSGTIICYDMLGRQVFVKRVSLWRATNVINLERLLFSSGPGLYTIRVEQSNGSKIETQTRSLIIL
ncbi:MAG: T9SS type A sorting domain-containing protein [bacterium]